MIDDRMQETICWTVIIKGDSSRTCKVFPKKKKKTLTGSQSKKVIVDTDPQPPFLYKTENISLISLKNMPTIS